MENPSGPSVSKQLGVLLIVLLLLGTGFTYVKWQQAEKRLMLVQNQPGAGSENQEAAKRIVEQVGKLFAMPAGIQPQVLAVVDVEALRKSNAFYNRAKNGDYIVVAGDRAILFDVRANIIVDVIPIQRSK